MDLSVTKYNYIPAFSGRKRTYTDEYLEKTFLPYVEADIPYKQAIKENNVALPIVNAWSNTKYGMPFRNLYSTGMNRTLGERLKSMYEAGLKVTEIAKKEKHSVKWVAKVFKEFDLLKTYEKRQKLFETYIPSMIKAGYTLERMIKELRKKTEKISVTDSYISDWIKLTYGKSLIEIRKSNKIRINRENVDYESLKAQFIDIFIVRGGTISEASEETGMSKSMIASWLERFGIETKMQEAKKKLDQILERRMAQGYSPAEIAEESGLTIGTVNKRAKERFKTTFAKAQKQLIKTYFSKR